MNFELQHGGDEMPAGAAANFTAGSVYHNNVLLAHGIILTLVFFIIAPISFIFANAKKTSQHIALMSFGSILALIAILMGYFHKDSDEDMYIVNSAMKPHSVIGTLIFILMILQATSGVGKYFVVMKRIRPLMRFVFGARQVHRWLGYFIFVAGIIQCIIGYTLYYGLCIPDSQANCTAHWSAAFLLILIGFGFLALVLFQIQLPRSLEFYTSCIYIIFGLGSMMFEPPWGKTWKHGDVFHFLLLGLLFFVSGIAGVAFESPMIQRVLSRNGQRSVNFIPAITLLFLGVSFLFHAQDPPISTFLHAALGVLVLPISGLALVMLVSDAMIIKALISFFLVLCGVILIGASHNLMLSANVFFMGGGMEYLALLVCVAFGIYIYGLLMMLAVKYINANDYELQKDTSKEPLDDATLAINTQETDRDSDHHSERSGLEDLELQSVDLNAVDLNAV